MYFVIKVEFYKNIIALIMLMIDLDRFINVNLYIYILYFRCQYFAGILSGGWVESAGNVIVLPPWVNPHIIIKWKVQSLLVLLNQLFHFRFSFNVVHFALCHIYSGLSTIPDTISIVELATIADMLGLEGLKEAIMFTLKAKYCHHFHRVFIAFVIF